MAAALGHASSRRRAYIVQAHRCPQIRRCSPIRMHASPQHRLQRGHGEGQAGNTALGLPLTTAVFPAQSCTRRPSSRPSSQSPTRPSLPSSPGPPTRQVMPSHTRPPLLPAGIRRTPQRTPYIVRGARGPCTDIPSVSTRPRPIPSSPPPLITTQVTCRLTPGHPRGQGPLTDLSTAGKP
jgi:hypothetical protein